MTKTLSLDLDRRTEAAVYLAGAVALAATAFYAWQSGDVIPLVVLGSLLGVVIILNDDEVSPETEAVSEKKTVPKKAVPDEERVHDEEIVPEEYRDIGGASEESKS